MHELNIFLFRVQNVLVKCQKHFLTILGLGRGWRSCQLTAPCWQYPETVLVSIAIALFILGNLENCPELKISSESMDCPSDLTSATMCQTHKCSVNQGLSCRLKNEDVSQTLGSKLWSSSVMIGLPLIGRCWGSLKGMEQDLHCELHGDFNVTFKRFLPWPWLSVHEIFLENSVPPRQKKS